MRFLRWLATLAWAGVIFYLSSRTWGGVEPFPHADKVIHLILYAGLGFLCVWSLRVTALRGRAQILPLAALMAFLYGVSDELHQLFVTGRNCDVVDLLFDGLGGFIGAWVAVRVARRIRKDEPSV